MLMPYTHMSPGIISGYYNIELHIYLNILFTHIFCSIFREKRVYILRKFFSEGNIII